MPDNDDKMLARAKAFFERAQKVAETDNFEYAIDLYLEGLRCAPDAVEDGHIPLCELGLRRQGKGGKKPSLLEKVKLLRGKTPLERMLNAECLFVKDTHHLPYAETMLKSAVLGGYDKTADWIANFIFQANNAVERPSLQTYLLLKDSYIAISQFDKALAACRRAIKLKPDDEKLADEYQNLSAELTVAKGRYDREGDFRQSIKDRESQEKLQAQQSVVKTEDYCVSAVDDARKALAAEPDVTKNIFNLADALADLQNDQAENEAIELLENTYKAKSDYSYKQRAGQIKIGQIRRRVSEAEAALKINPDDAQAKSRLYESAALLEDAEMEHYRMCVENYPTDLRAKYEYALRLLRNEQYDDAIPLFQDAQRDPRNKISAMDKTGLCFFMKGWFADAIDIFTQAIKSYELKDDDIAKELRYNLGRAYQQQGDVEKALEIFRKIAQLDFAYKDVRQRIDELRKTGKQEG